ncbi:MAG: ComF family protein [Syntrophorhabdus sp.]
MGGGSTSTVHSFFNSALALFYPGSCVVCGASGEALCSQCISEFKVINETEVCPVCGKMGSGRAIVCISCSRSKTYFTRGIYGYHYEGRVREAIHAFKFEGHKEVGRKLVRLIAKKFCGLENEIDYIVPMPVSRRRLRERGFNQSFIISEEISRITGIPLCYRDLVKIKDVRGQFTLTKTERRNNIRGAFTIRDRSSLKTKRLLLVDDLLTTGYTAVEAAKALRKTNPGEIILFALARTP